MFFAHFFVTADVFDRWVDWCTVMPPLEFMQRRAVLRPWPRLHLICFHELLAIKPKQIPYAEGQSLAWR